MASLSIRNVSIDFPIFGSKKNLRLSLLAGVTGGRILPHQMKVGRIELAHLFQPVPVGNPQPCSLGFDQALGPHLLKHPVDVNRGKAERVGKLALGDRQVTDMVLGQAHRLQAHQQLA